MSVRARINAAFAGVFAALLLVGIPAGIIQACPFCSAPSLTLSEQFVQSDAVVLVKWVSGEPRKEGDSAGSTTYEIVEVAKSGRTPLKPGDQISLVRYRAAQAGDLFLLMGSENETIEWASPEEVTESSYAYIKGLPDPKKPTTQRLKYFLKFLEDQDLLVSNDAYAEFANAPYADIALLAEEYPREKLRQWVSDESTQVTRLGLYGLLLGLCGNEDDARMMAGKISGGQTDDFRLGIDGVMSGYLLITGADGLELLDRTKLKPRYLLDADGKPVLDEQGKKKPVPFSETYAAMQALRFMWTYSDGRIPKPRLRQSMRILLDRPELADLVIADLARWKDWDVQDELIKLYDAEGYDIPSIKRAIVRYYFYCAKDIPEGQEDLPAYAVKAKGYLEDLEERDPKTVREAKRFLLP